MKITTIMLCLVLFIVFICFIKKYIYYKNAKKHNKGRIKREDLSFKYFNNKSSSCKDMIFHSSFGLLLDASIVCNALKNIEVQPFIHFEMFKNSSPKHILIPNLDCTDFKSLKHKNSPGTLLCKTKQTYNILREKIPHKKIVYTGFTSIDRINKINIDYTKFLHITGKSPWKGTIQVIKAWIRNPQWPEITIIYNKTGGKWNTIGTDIENIRQQNGIINNIKFIDYFITDNDLFNIMNFHGIHICPSEHEGFGHTLNEGRSVEAVVLYTDAPCMNEGFEDMVTGIGISAYKNKKLLNDICPVYNVSIKEIEKSVNKVLGMSKRELQKIGINARKQYVIDDKKFKEKIRNYIVNYG